VSVIAEAVRHMLAAGMTGDALVDAIAAMELALKAERPSIVEAPKSASALRMQRKRERDRASQSVTSASHVTVCDAPANDVESPGNLGRASGLVPQIVASQTVTLRNESVTGDAAVTRRGKKERSPTPPKEKTTTPNPPKGGFPPGVTARLASRMVIGEQVWVHADDALFGTLGGNPSKIDRSGGWWFRLDAFRRVEARMQVAHDPPDRMAGAG
jgi:hypothetical protein